MSVYVETNTIGKATFVHTDPSSLTSSEKEGGTLFDSIPTNDDDSKSLFVVDGSLKWKKPIYELVAAGDVDGLRKRLKQQAAYNRWKFEREGVTVDGTHFRSSETTRQALTTTIIYAERYNKNHSDEFVANWRLETGGFVKMYLSDLQDLMDAIAAKRESGFDQESNIIDNLNAASTIDELLAVDLTIS